MKPISPRVIFSFLLLCCFWLPMELEASSNSLFSANFDVRLDKAVDRCTDVTDFNTCTFGLPFGQNTITIGAGEVIYMEYVVENTGTTPISQTNIDDDLFGSQLGNGGGPDPGNTSVFRRVNTAPNTPGTYNVNVHFSATDALGNPVTAVASYTIIVAAPQATLEVRLVEAEGRCTDLTDFNSCTSGLPAGSNTLTVPPGEVLYMEYLVENTGISEIRRTFIVDDLFGQQLGSGGAPDPGNTSNFRRLNTAPTTPGTYVVNVVFSGEDNVGNPVSTSASYTLIVAAPQVDFEVKLVRATERCTDITEFNTCSIGIPSGQNTLTVGPGEVVYLEYYVENTGISELRRGDIQDDLFGQQLGNGGVPDPGEDFTYRRLDPAPMTPGTYNVNVVFSAEDLVGNPVSVSVSYILTVTPPLAVINPAIIAADDFCTNPTQLVSCGTNIPGSPNTLTIGGGEPVYIEYAVTNTGSNTITQAEIEDSQFGTVISSTTNINVGSTLTYRTLQVAPTTPGTYDIDITFTGNATGGVTAIATGTYTIIVEGPSATINPAVIAADDFCTDPTQLTSCGVNIPGSPNSLTIGAGEPVYLEYAVTNTGPSTLVMSVVEDSQFGTLFSGGTSIGPGNTNTFRFLEPAAPTIPGTYDIDVTYTGSDAAGNSVTVVGTYTIIIPAPSATINPAVIAADDFCTDPTSLLSCGLNIPGSPNTLTIGAGEPVYLEYAVTNTGPSTLVMSVVEDSQFGTLFSGGTSIGPGNTTTFRFLEPAAPTIPGTYDIDVTYTGTDAVGNSVTVAGTYTIIVPAPSATINPAVIAADDFCTDPTSLLSCGVNIPGSPNSLTIGAGEPVYLEYAVTNTGSSTLVMSVVEDSQFGTLFSGGTTIGPGNTTTFRFLEPAAPTVPGTYDIDVTYTGSDAAGNSVTIAGTYTIIVPTPSATINPAVIAADDFCTDPTQLTSCGVNIPGSPDLGTVLPNEQVYLEFAVTNTGISSLVMSEVEDSQFGTLFSGGSTIGPGNTTTFRFLQTAPSAPGIYDIDVTYTGEDQAGNEATVMGTYTIIVEGPNADFRVLLGDGDDFCTDETDLSTCSQLPLSAPNTITLVQNEPYLLQYLIESTGTSDIIQHEITDEEQGTVLNAAFPLAPGLSTRLSLLLTAPDVPGTYTIEAVYEGSDINGTEVIVTATYTLIVLDLDANFNVAVADANSFCTDPTNTGTCGFLFPDQTNTASVPPGAPVYLEYQVTDAGDVPVVLHSVVDNTYGTVVLNDPTDISLAGEVIFRALQNAPTVAGIYDYTASYTGEDDDGNQIMREATYTLIVGCPEECFIQGPSGTVCPGTYEFSADFDATICSNPSVDWVVTDAAGGTQTYTGNPVMIPLEGCAEDYTIESTVSCIGCTEPAVCTTTLTTEDTTPPDMQCTTIEVTFDACPDGFGPNFPNGEWLTVGPTGILNEAFGGVFTFPVDLNGCLSDNCTDLAELEYTLNDAYTESITPGCSITLISELQFRDKCGNISPNLLILRGTIEESNPTPPTVSCPGDQTITCLDSTDPSATGMATGSDDCDDEVDIDFMDSSVAGCGNTEVITRTWTATNGCGLTASCEQIITVVSVEPTISCPVDITIDCGASSDPSNTGMATGEDPCGGMVDITSSDVFVPGCSAATGTITRTWTATNECGLSTSCEQVITIVDNTAPEFDLSCQIDETYTTENSAVCPADAFISLSEGDELTVNDGWTVGGIAILPLSGCVSDDCSTDAELTITVDDITVVDDGTCSRTITVTFLADDGCGNVSDPFTCNYTFLDDTAPVFDLACQIGAVFTTENGNVCPADATISLSEGDELTVNDGWTVGGIAILPLSGCVSDNCTADNDLTITVDDITVVDDGTCSRTITVTFLADDGCGNVSDPFVCNYTFLDDTGPVVNFNGIPDGGTYVIECDLQSASWDPLVDIGELTIADNCSAIDFDGITEELTQLYDGPCLGNLLTRWQQVFTVQDVCGNTTVYTLFTEIIDTTPPAFTDSPEDVTIECDEIAPVPELEAFDSCSDVVYNFTEVRTDGDCPNNYTLTRTWTATDGCGNSSNEVQIVTVEDTSPPVIQFIDGYINQYESGQDVFVECSELGNISLLIANNAIASDNCSGQTQVSYTLQDLGGFDCQEFGYSGALISTWTSTDECGNTATATINWFLVDETAPVFQGLPEDVCAEAGNLPPVANVQAVDGCELPVLTFHQSDPIDCDGGQYIERTWTAEDVCGNSNSYTQRITISAGNGPSITIDYPEIGDVMDGELVQIPIDCTQPLAFSEAALRDAITINNSCGAGQSSIDLILMNEGNCAENGYLARYNLSVSATDACGNSATFSLQVDFVDETPPVIAGDTEIRVSCGEAIPMPVAQDACGEVVSMTFVDSAPIEVSCPDTPLAYERSWTATDECGNSTTFTQLITVLDNEGPVFSGVPADACNNTGIDVVIRAVDECTGEQTEVFFEETTSSESGCGEVLTRTWTATDACGNTSTATQQVFFDDDQAPTIVFTDDLLVGLQSGDELFLSVGDGLGDPSDPLLFTAEDVSVTDNCATLTAEVTITTIFSEDCAADGYLAQYGYLFTATDPCGNSSVAKLTVYYVDNNAPDLFNVPADQDVFCTDVPPAANVIASDDYTEEVELLFSETQTTTADGILITRTWTATDDCGNTNSASQEILVVNNDLSASFSLGSPVIECNSDNNRLGVSVMGGTPPYSYQWQLTDPLEDGYITTDPTKAGILFTMGYITQTFSVLITDDNGCELLAAITVVCDFEDDEGDFLVSGENNNSELRVYPNPVTNYFQIRAAELVEQAVTVRLYNLWGQEVIRTTIDYWPQDGTQINTSSLPAGTYLLHLEQAGKAPLVREIVILD
ncbi:MAG: T9SS type A sorting domain-containing protein [Bacteroidota bacterium]